MNGGVRPVCWESRMESRRECTCLQGTQTSPSGAFRGGGTLAPCCQISLEKLKIQTVSRNLPVFKHLLRLCRSRERNVGE